MYVLIIYVLLCVLTAYSLFAKKGISKKWQFGIMIALFLFFLLRFNLGNDTYTYAWMFDNIPDNWYFAWMNFNGRFPLFSVGMRMFSLYGGDFAAWQFTMNLIVLILFADTISRNSDHILLSCLIWVGSGILQVYYTSAMRQMICMAIFLMAFYRFLIKGKYWQYYVFMIPCCLIQEISYVMLLVPFIYGLIRFLWSKKGILVVGILFCIGFVMFNIIPTVTASFLPQGWADYFNGTNQITFSIFGIGLECILFAVVLILYHWCDDDYKKDWKVRFQVYVCFFAFLFYLIFARISLMSRVCDYLTVIHVILIPNLFMHMKNRKNLTIAFSAIALLNAALLFVDLKDSMTGPFYKKDIMHFPYVSVFRVEDAYKYYNFGKYKIR